MPYIAIVDDEESVRNALKRLLCASGFAAETYASGQDFLRGIPEGQPDCVVLDIDMPGMSGVEVLHRLRAMALDMPVIVVTGFDSAETKAQCNAAGIVGYLRKPGDSRLLLNAISAALSASKRLKR